MKNIKKFILIFLVLFMSKFVMCVRTSNDTTPVSNTPVITSLSSSSFYTGQTIVIYGTNFSESVVELNTIADGSGTSVGQTKISQTSTQINITIVQGGLSLGTVYLIVTNTDGNSNTGYNCSLTTESLLYFSTSERLIDWSNSGVTGGISQYQNGGSNARTLGANVMDYGADPTGAINSNTAFANALAATSAGQYMYIPDGTYLITSALSGKSNVTIRGQSTKNTIIKLGASNRFLSIGGQWPGPQPTLTVTAGATKGSTVLTLNDTSTVVVGNHILLSILTPSYCHANLAAGWTIASWVGHGDDRLMTIFFLVTAKNDTNKTITLSDPLPIDMTDTPMVTVYSVVPKSKMGLENFTLDANGTSNDRMMYFSQTTQCWLDKVYFKQPSSRSAWIQDSTHFTVQRCYSANGVSKGMNSEGLDFYQNACWNLVQNNVFISAGFPMIMYGDWQGGCVGNATIFNYQYGENQMADDDGVGPVSMCDGHGPVEMFNLWEGNYIEVLASDGYWGSSCYGTVFRNRISGVTLAMPTYYDQCALMLAHWTDYWSIVGNILGTSGRSTIYEASGSNVQNPQIYRLGYPWMGNRTSTGSGSNPSDSQYMDTFVKESLIRHGNFDYVNNSVIWDDNYNHTLDNSLFFDSAPSWWGDCDWPAIGPDVSGYFKDTPAKKRYDAFVISGDLDDLF